MIVVRASSANYIGWNCVCFDVGKLVLDITGPGNVLLFDLNFIVRAHRFILCGTLTFLGSFENLERVIEHAFGHEAAGDGGPVSIHLIRCFCDAILLIGPEVFDVDDGIAVGGNLLGGAIIAIELHGIPGLHVPPVVLVEVVQLIVHINGLSLVSADFGNVKKALFI